EYGLTFPLDFGARGSCTIGGSLATNAGGNGVIRYGVARGLALGLEAVLADGTILTSLNRMVKNSSGYDLKQLFIGSEGTLGVITRAVLRLYPSLPHRTTVLISAPSFDGVQGILVLAKSRLGAGLTAFEVMWQSYVQAVLAVYPELRSLVSLAPGFWCLIEHERASGDDDAEVEAFLEAATRAGHANDALLAQSERQTEEFWRLRDGAGELLTLWRHPLAFDVSLPIAAMPDYCAQVETALRQRFAELPFTCFGHLGDGTLHFVLDAPAEEDKEWLVATILELVRPHGGAISAEHGIGVLKKPWLHLSRSPGEIEVMRRLKRLLDPHGILNPGRVFTP
ncbi:MAG TPA: FAD-binding oxidoreductase, partial [Steroidobacteraceae bacterium]|nr:FAD-binding oxidoreductase [Steroidobacteraceae bacterium]